MLNIQCLKCEQTIKTTWLAEILNPACQNVTCFSCGSRHELKFPLLYTGISGLFFAGTLILLTKVGLPGKLEWLKVVCAAFVTIIINPFLIFGLGKWKLAPKNYKTTPSVDWLTFISRAGIFIFAIGVTFSALWLMLIYRDMMTSFGDEGMDALFDSINKFQHESKTKLLIAMITSAIAMLVSKITWYIRSKKIVKLINSF